ncbi:hypothetical protein LK533_02895 [Sphingomonas sp. PL-96]|uniref:hypothetical protein n=1 Tax=Sphingomonas sp. PL-96 TaxID=2887201 RepID=UPI001E4438B5|nr:hypothetical protein [Sphingomonas sp. PL-96]MCC2975621.1 hypothetical protein [Sphingomonas sp. PL-96]
MTAWHRTRRADLGLRVLGLSLCGLSGAAIAQLCAMRVGTGPSAVLPYALAALGYLGASAGSALALLGGRLFAPGAVSERWRRQPEPEPYVLRAAVPADLRPSPIWLQDLRPDAYRMPVVVAAIG